MATHKAFLHSMCSVSRAAPSVSAQDAVSGMGHLSFGNTHNFYSKKNIKTIVCMSLKTTNNKTKLSI